MRLLVTLLLCARALRPTPLRARPAVGRGQTRAANIVRSSTADGASTGTPTTFGDRTVGGVRLDRISRLVVAAGAAFGGYVLGNDYLNVAIVEVLGIDRSQGVGAFGPFVTLLALIYSTILGSIYSQLSSRQGAIQDSLFAEAFAVRDVGEVCDIVDRSSKTELAEARRAIRAHAETLRDAVDGEAADGADQASLARLLRAVDEVDAASNNGAACARAVQAYGTAVSARSARGYGRLPLLVRPMLAQFSQIAAQTDDDAARFLALGAGEAALHVTGNIKFDLELGAAVTARAEQLRRCWRGSNKRPVLVGASTHAGEDSILLTALTLIM